MATKATILEAMRIMDAAIACNAPPSSIETADSEVLAIARESIGFYGADSLEKIESRCGLTYLARVAGLVPDNTRLERFGDDAVIPDLQWYEVIDSFDRERVLAEYR